MVNFPIIAHFVDLFVFSFQSLKQVTEEQLETEEQLKSVKKELATVGQENELLNKEMKVLRERVIDLDEVKVSFNDRDSN